MKKRKSGPPDPVIIAEKIRYFCSYRERSIRETEAKLSALQYPKSGIPALIRQLQADGYLSGERFAKTFATGKFHVNKWGKRKIEFEMKLRGLPESLIRLGLDEIGGEEYRETLRDLLIRKANEIKPGKNLKKREKIINFALGKGFETSLVLEILKELKI